RESSALHLPFFAGVFGGQGLTQNARMLSVILLSLMVTVTLVETVNMVILPVHALRWLSIIAAVDGLSLVLISVNQRQRTRLAIIIGLQFLAAHTARNAFRQVNAELAERQRTESALRESEQRYREVFEKTSDCIFLLDVTSDGRFRVARFNPAEEKSVGVTNAQ